MSKKQMKLGVFMMAPGHHVAAWRHDSAQADLGANFRAFAKMAQQAEAAKFDMFFLDDAVGVKDPSRKTGSRVSRAAFFEPLTLLSALAAVTNTIGLAATASTTYNDPYTLARKFASLDLISDGRAAWNLVTSNTEEEARNYTSAGHLAHASRYERAEEFISVVLGLWNSYADDAFVRDKKSGIYFDYDKMNTLGHNGKHFSVHGPLNIARSPQGHTVVVQAGSSEPGRELAARTAEVVFTIQQTLEEGRAYYSDLKGRMAKYGRRPDQLLIMPGIFPVVGRSRQEAEEKFEELQDLIHPDVGIGQLGYMLNVDLSQYPLDGPVPQAPETNGGNSKQKALYELAHRENLTINQLAKRTAGARGHWQK